MSMRHGVLRVAQMGAGACSLMRRARYNDYTTVNA